MEDKNPYILLVEDDPDDREMLKGEILLRQPGIRLETFQNGSQALSFLKDCKNDELPAIIVVDYQMPDMVGSELLGSIAGSERYNKMVKVMWSTSDREQYVRRCMLLGARIFFRKPNDKKELTAIVNYLTDCFHSMPTGQV